MITSANCAGKTIAPILIGRSSDGETMTDFGDIAYANALQNPHIKIVELDGTNTSTPLGIWPIQPIPKPRAHEEADLDSTILEAAPQVGEIRKAHEIGYKKQYQYYIWRICPDCESVRWVPCTKNGLARYLKCQRCATKALVGRNNPSWNGGRKLTDDGYIEVILPTNSFFAPMLTKGGYVREHRLIMAQHLKRCLLPWEIVHHINGIRTDNRLENLELIKGNQHHAPFNILQQENKRLRKLVERLQNEVNRLRAKRS